MPPLKGVPDDVDERFAQRRVARTPTEGFPDLSDDQLGGLPGLQYGCFYDKHFVYGPEGKIQTTEFIYLDGDWAASRTR
jgi:hypothetical protein